MLEGIAGFLGGMLSEWMKQRKLSLLKVFLCSFVFVMMVFPILIFGFGNGHSERDWLESLFIFFGMAILLSIFITLIFWIRQKLNHKH